ncbi:hypothetical protein DF223_12065 [Mycetocola zhujimingii]|uniref:DUF3137 domain-containing protein n=1 Tax=Mycetocola zhujimingii TaxID=2079792 RepID=A0A2U1TBT2_9MICO|nr:hypothetical protein DF223_12065 [Mycetocola zhujimingii]
MGAPERELVSGAEATALDLRALGEPVSRSDLRSFRHTSIAAGVPRLDPTAPSLRGWLTVIGMAVFGVLSALVGVLVLLDGISVTSIVVALVSAFLVFGSTLIVGRFSWPRWGSRLWRDRYRIARFAEQNGARYTAAMPTPQLAGMLFPRGDRRRASDVVDFGVEAGWSVGNLSYLKNLPKGGAEQHVWGYVSVELPRRFPHIVLDSLSNHGLRGRELENPYSGQGAIALEGDFSRHFRMTCPPGYERDALYLLTPDLMAVLIDEGRDFDIEVVDNRLFLYRPRPFALAEAAEWERIRRIIDTIAEGAYKRTVNYRDERVGDVRTDIVADGGRRLPTPNLTVIVLVTYAVCLLAAVAAGFLGG